MSTSAAPTSPEPSNFRLKKIIGGMTYDTQTSTLITGGDDEWSSNWWQLYQTRHGAFFTVVFDGYGCGIRPKTDEEARVLVEGHANHLYEQVFGAAPEAGAAERRLTVRMPAGLARRIENAAKAVSLNTNAYILRKMEQAVSADGHPPSYEG